MSAKALKTYYDFALFKMVGKVNGNKHVSVKLHTKVILTIYYCGRTIYII